MKLPAVPARDQLCSLWRRLLLLQSALMWDARYDCISSDAALPVSTVLQKLSSSE